MMNKENLFKISLLTGDIVLLYIALFLTLMIRNGVWQIWKVVSVTNFFYHFSILYIGFVIFLFTLDFYDLHFLKNFHQRVFRLLIFSFFALFLSMAYFYFRPILTFTPKTILLLNVFIFDILFLVWRHFFTSIIIKRFKEKILLIGSVEKTNSIFKVLPPSGYVIKALYLPQSPVETSHLSSIDIISHPEGLSAYIDKEHIKTVVFSEYPDGNRDKVYEILSSLPAGITCIHFSDFYERLTGRVSLEYVSERWFLERISESRHTSYFALKRVFDIVLSLLFFIITLILFPFIAIVIKLDSPGTIFYKQKRVGQNRTVFTVWKFRTMRENSNGEQIIWREKNPFEVTRVGKFLRRFHLDELPQSVSILKGDLSFVGPRPEWLQIAELFEKEIPFYEKRYLVKPGFTGWAQINFPPSNSVEEAKEKFEYDLYYLKNHSNLLDLIIVLKTIRLILKH